jgi:hypothetical protein
MSLNQQEREGDGMSARSAARLGAAALMLLMMAVAPNASADATQAKNLFKAMSDYLGKQTKMSLDLDTSLEVVTKDQQKLSLTSSGSLTMVRPDKVRMARHGGFANAELYFNGQTLSLFRRDQNIYSKIDIPGSVEHLIGELRDKYQRPLPAADLLSASVYEAMMPDVKDVKDLGSGFIRGIECDHIAFRTDEVDWQVWIAQGDRPYPVRLIVTSKKVTGSPQYQIDVTNFKTGDQVSTPNFNFAPPPGAKQVDPSQLASFDELPDFFKPQEASK